LLISPNIFSQTKRITGIVRDENCNGLPGVTVSPLDLNNPKSITSIDGNFTIDVPTDVSVLVFEFAGYNTYAFRLGELAQIEIKLTPITSQIGEINIWPNYNLYLTFIGGSNYLPYGTGLDFIHFFDWQGQSIDISISASLRTNFNSNKYFELDYSFNRLRLQNVQINFVNSFKYYNLTYDRNSYLINDYNIGFDISKKDKHFSILTGIGFQSYNSIKSINSLGFLGGVGYSNNSNTIQLKSEYYTSDNFQVNLEYAKNSKKLRILNFKIGLSYEKMKTLEEISFYLKFMIIQKKIITL